MNKVSIIRWVRDYEDLCPQCGQTTLIKLHVRVAHRKTQVMGEQCLNENCNMGWHVNPDGIIITDVDVEKAIQEAS